MFFKAIERSLLALFLLATFLPAPVHAQQCPESVEYPVLSLVEGLPVMDPAGRGEIARVAYLDYMVAQTFEESRKGGLRTRANETIAVTTRDGIKGLVDAKLVMTFRTTANGSCMANRALMRDISPISLDKDNNLQAKAFLGITLDHLARRGEEEDIPGIRMRNAPATDAAILRAPKHYLLAYVFAVFKDARNSTWYLVGPYSDPKFFLDEDGNVRTTTIDSFLGWVHSEDLVLWPQRQAIFPRDSNAEMRIFPGTSLTDEGTGTVFSIDFEDESAPEQRNALLKYSLLRELPNSAAYEIAFPQVRLLGDETSGAATNPSGALESTENRKGSGDSGQIANDDIRVWLKLLSERVGTLDVLFVLDNSESMVRYRDAVIDGIEELNTKVGNADQLQITYTLFGDYFASPAAAKAWSTQDGRDGFLMTWEDGMPEGQPFQFWMEKFDSGQFPSASKLRDVFGGEYDDPQSDAEEMGLAALKLAVETAPWRPNSLRLVVYIGDDASRPFPGKDIVESAGAVANAIIDSESFFLPINVAGQAVDENNDIWIAQANTIGRAISQDPSAVVGAFPTVVAYDSAGNALESEGTRAAVYNGIGALFVISSGFEEGEFDISAARARAQEMGVPLALAETVLGKFTGATISDLERLALRYDVLRTGYYPIADAETYVAMDNYERQDLQNALSTACVGLEDSSRLQRALEDMADSMTQAFLGEERMRVTRDSPEGETIPEFFARLTNLPSDYFSVFGDRDLNQFVDYMAVLSGKMETDTTARAEYRSIQSEICLSAKLFQDVGLKIYSSRESYTPEYIEDYRSFDFIAREDLKENFEWRWGVGEGLTLYFVPQSHFPIALQ